MDEDDFLTGWLEMDAGEDLFEAGMQQKPGCFRWFLILCGLALFALGCYTILH